MGDDGHQHGVEVERRTDRLADFAQRAHFFDRARERLGARLELLEHADVFDSDHRLIGERLEERDLAVGKGPGDGPRDPDHADRAAFARHRHRHHAPPAAARGNLTAILGVGEGVVYMNHGATEYRPPRRLLTARAHRVHAAQELEDIGRQVVVGDQMNELAIETEDGAEERTAEHNRVAGDRVEDLLDARLGLIDDAQDLARRRLLLQCLLRIFEQAHVLDCDHGLIGKGMQQLDLLSRKRAHRRT